MARARSPNRDKAYKLWIDSNKTKLLKDIAAELNISEGQVRKWKNQDKWEESKGNVTNEIKGNVTNEKNTKKNCVLKEELEELEGAELTDKQKLFCIYYVKYFNASKAALKAGYSQSYSVSDVYKLLDNPRVKEEINRLKRNKLGRAIISEDDIFQKMIDIAFADITDYLEFGQEEVPVMTMHGPLEVKNKETGEKEQVTKLINTVKFKESTEIDGTIISEVKQGKDGASIKLHDKMKALQWLGDRMDLLPRVTQERLLLEKSKLMLLVEQSKGEDKSNPIADIAKKMEVRRYGNAREST